MSKEEKSRESTKTIKKGFRSEIDLFFHDFDKNRALPLSRLEEIRRAQIIANKRDES
jgi:hypothetical protein